jgi:hypothetical protein
VQKLQNWRISPRARQGLVLVTTLAIIGLAWVGISAVGTLLVVAFLRVGARADSEHDRVIVERTLGFAGVRHEHPLVIERVLQVASRRPRG